MTARAHLVALRAWLRMYPAHLDHRTLAGITGRDHPRGAGWAIEGDLHPLREQVRRRLHEVTYWAGILRRWVWSRHRYGCMGQMP